MMIKELDWGGIANLSTLGKPMTVGGALSASGGDGVTTRALLTVPDGHCFIAERFTGVNSGNDSGIGIVASPAISGRPVTGLVGSIGVDAVERIQTMPWVRWAALFNAGAGDTWRNAPVIDTWQWRPKWPICFPAGRLIRNLYTQLSNNGNMIYGYLVPETTAAALGFDTRTEAAKRTASVTTASPVNTSALEAIPAREGFSIQILDLWMRVQPLTTGTACFLRLQQNLATVVRPFLQLNNDNPANFCEEKLSPGMFLAPGASLEVLSSAAFTGTATISYRYVRTEDVPDDHWWAHVAPAKSGTGAPPLAPPTNPLGVFAAPSEAIIPYFPARNVVASGGLAGRGMQLFLNGFLMSMTHDGTLGAIAGAHSWYRLSAGAVGGRIGLGTGGAFQTELGSPLTAMLGCGGQETTASLSESQLSVRTAENQGIWIDQASFGITAADAHLRNVHVTAWGRRGATQGDTVGTFKRGTQG